MKQGHKIIVTALFAATSLITMNQTIHAANPNFAGATIARLNGEGFRTCKAMSNSGYTAVVRGIVSEGGGESSGGSQVFQVRTCFKTSSTCEHFLKRIHHTIGKIEKIRYLKCKSRA